MATMQEYIERLIYQFTSTGADKVADDMNKVGAAQTTTSTSALNLEKSFNSLERRMDSSVRAAQDYAKIQAQVAAAVAQNPALQERANNILALAEQRYAAAARGGSLYGQALNAGQAQMQSYAAQAGILGDALTALGTKGLAGAAAIGGLTLAYKAASDQAHELGQKAIDLKKFADTTGLSTNQVQALRIEAGKVGVGSEETETALQRFTLSFEAVRQGSGQALETLRRYRPELAEQMRDTRDTATAIDILSQAYVGLTTAQQNALSRSFFGRGGVDMSRLMSGLNFDEATEKFAASGRGFTQAQAEVISKLEIENRRLQKIWSEGFAKMFAEDLLRGENAFLATLIQINAELKNAKPPQELMVALRALSALGTLPFVMAGAAGGIAARAGIAGSVGKEQPATFNERFGALPSMTPIADELDRAAKSAEKINEEFRNLPAREIVAMGESVAREFDKAGQTIADLNRKIEDMLNALSRGGNVDLLGPALDAAQVLLKTTQDTRAETERHNAALLQLAQTYQGMSLQVAEMLQKQKDQLAIASTTTGQARMAAQQQATINDLLLQGKTLEEATAVAAGQRAIAQAQINAGAQQSLAALQSQSAVANARTTDERLAAQEIATQVNLMRQGVSEEMAAAIAAQERANAEAQINVAFEKQLATAQAVSGLQKIMLMDWREQAVAIAEANSNLERQTHSLQQQNELTIARSNGNEASVAAQQAYNNAIDSGADSAHAQANAEQVRLKYQLQINEQVNQEQQARQKAFEAEVKQADMEAERADKALWAAGSAGAKSAADSMSQVLQQLNDLGDHTYDYFRNLAIGAMSVQQALTMAGALQNQLTKIQAQQKAEAEQKQKAEEQKQQAEAASQKYQGFEDQIQQLQNQRALAEARKISPEAEAQVQSQQAYAKAIADGATAAQAQQIADLTLANALAQNTSAVQSNTEALSPYYASDPRLSHLGFRAGSSALDYDPFAQPATGAAGPAALPFGSTTATSSGLASAGSSEEEGHWEGGGLSMKWVGSGPPNYSQLKAWTQGLAGGGVIPPGGIAYVGEHGPNPGLLRAGNEQIVVTPSGMQGLTGPSPGQPRSGKPYLVTHGGMEMDARDLLQGLTGASPGQQSRGGAPYLVARNGMQMDARDLTQGAGGGRPIQIVQNFNAPVDRSVAAEMKISAYQAAQSGMRSLRAVR